MEAGRCKRPVRDSQTCWLRVLGWAASAGPNHSEIDEYSELKREDARPAHFPRGISPATAHSHLNVHSKHNSGIVAFSTVINDRMFSEARGLISKVKDAVRALCFRRSRRACSRRSYVPCPRCLRLKACAIRAWLRARSSCRDRRPGYIWRKCSLLRACNREIYPGTVHKTRSGLDPVPRAYLVLEPITNHGDLASF
jgi:hypothetical protein